MGERRHGQESERDADASEDRHGSVPNRVRGGQEGDGRQGTIVQVHQERYGTSGALGQGYVELESRGEGLEPSHVIPQQSDVNVVPEGRQEARAYRVGIADDGRS